MGVNKSRCAVRPRTGVGMDCQPGILLDFARCAEASISPGAPPPPRAFLLAVQPLALWYHGVSRHAARLGVALAPDLFQELALVGVRGKHPALVLAVKLDCAQVNVEQRGELAGLAVASRAPHRAQAVPRGDRVAPGHGRAPARPVRPAPGRAAPRRPAAKS